MNFQNYLQISAEEIEKELDIFLKSWEKEVNKTSPKLKSLVSRFIKSCRGGKRLRGALVKLGFELAKVQSSKLKVQRYGKDILKPAVAYEIFQTAILAHDDIIDRSDLRRNQPTLWKMLGGDHYGISQTICLGDIGFFLAYKIISESKFLAPEKNKAVELFSKAMLDTGLGQMLDVALPQLKSTKSKSDILEIYRLKTARYTLVGPLQLGAILAGANQDLLEVLKDFGEKLGMAFQIQDDILGVFGDEKILGKSITSDIEEGKNTLLIIEALKKANPKQKKFLEKYYGKGKIREKELAYIRQIFINTGALDYSKEYAEKLVKEAKKLISQITTNNELGTLLIEMADFLVSRSK